MLALEKLEDMKLFSKAGLVNYVICFLWHGILYGQSTSQEIPKKEELIELQLFKRNLEVIKQSTPDEDYLQDIVLKVSNDIININGKTQLLKEDSLKDLSVYELNYLETQHKNILKDVEKYKKEATELRTQMTLYKESLDTLYTEIESIRVDSLIAFLRTGNTDSVLGRDEAVFVEQFKSTKYEVEFARIEINQILGNLEKEMRLLNELSLLQVRNLALITRLSGSKLSIRSSPIWSIGRKNNFTEGTLSNFYDSVHKVQTYAVEYPWRFYLHFFIYAAIVAISLNFKRQKQLWEQYRTREDEIKHVLHPLSNPYIASFLLALSFTSWVHYGAPGDFFDVVLILLPLPILFFLYQIRLLVLLKEAALFSLVFSLIHIQHFIVFNSLFHRIALLTFSLLLLLVIRRIQKNYQGDYLKVFKYIFRVAKYTIVLAIIGNVFGYFEVSQFLISQISAGIVIAALFHISSYVITDIIKLFLLSERMQTIRSVKKNYGIIKQRTHQIIRWVAMIAWVAVVLKNSGFYNEVIDPVTAFLDKERSIGSVTYSIGGLFLFVFTIYLSTVLSSILEEIFKEDLSSQQASQRRNVGALTIMVRYGVITIGLFMAVAFSGLPVENITIIIGALGVGIGFGLQNIFNNLVSGFILAVEKPIQIGDIVQVDTFTGEVQDIGIRASKVKTFDGAEVIIPNGDLIASNVINWTHSDRFRRIELFVGVSYGTDTEKVIELIKEAIERSKLIRSYPEPVVVFHNFGASSLDFRVLCWTSIESFLQGKSELSILIDKLFKEHNISIPFPQRDLYIKSIDEIKIKEEGKNLMNNLSKENKENSKIS